MLSLIPVLTRNIVDMNPSVIVSDINHSTVGNGQNFRPLRFFSSRRDVLRTMQRVSHGGYALPRMNWLLYQSLKAESLKIPPGAVFVVGAGDGSLTACAEAGVRLGSAEGLALVLFC